MSDSYSQLGEDRIVASLLVQQTGKLLDIGAWDPITFSNSRLLIERGWEAVLIEPSPGPLRNLAKAYNKNPKVDIIAACVGFVPGLVELVVTDDAVSSSDPEVQARWITEGGYYGDILVPVITLQDIFNKYGGAFDFVSIDTEGTSVDIAIAYLLAGPRPKAMIVEHDERTVELMGVAQESGYKMVHANGTNVVLAL